MTAPWFYAPDLPHSGTISLDAREARHAGASRRLEVGQAVTLFDGRGGVAVGNIITAGGRDVQVNIDSHRQHAPPQRQLHLACALPKGDRQGTLLSMATQLGMTAFTPLHCHRSIVKAGRSFEQRSMRIMVEACKQSRRAHVPLLRPAATVEQALHNARDQGETILLAHPTGTPAAKHAISPGKAAVTVLIGPEGGFTDNEVNAARDSGGVIVSLGEAVLRIETAAIAALAVLRLQPDEADGDR